jgi:hypothetical protein
MFALAATIPAGMSPALLIGGTVVMLATVFAAGGARCAAS